MKAGAVEFLTKPFNDEVLLSAVRQALERSRLAIAHDTEMQELRNRYTSLTPREQQVMELVVSGLLNKQVGGELGISEITVKAHRGQVMQKMNADSLAALVSGGVDTGWTFYAPLSSGYVRSPVIVMAVGILIVGFSSIFTGLNFIVTIHRMRAPGMTWFRMPLFLWSMYATSLIMVLGTPVVAITIVLVAAERLFHFGFFDPRVGGDPVLFQHLFWFYSHPAVYIMILPAMGVISELVAAFCRKQVFGYKFVAFASVAIAVLGFLVWGHHMFVAGISVYAALIFSILSFLVAVPSAVKVFNWTATMYKGSVSWQTPMLYAIGFIGLFTIGGLTGLFLAAVGLDIHVTDTYFIVAHFHYIMVGGTIMGYLGGLHYWWPKISGRLYNEYLAKISAAIIFVGFNLTFFPQFIVGYLGMPRRYAMYPPEFQVYNVLSTAGATVLGVGYLLPMIYLKRCALLLATTTSGCASLRLSSILPIFSASTPTSHQNKIGTNQKRLQWRDIGGCYRGYWYPLIAFILWSKRGNFPWPVSSANGGDSGCRRCRLLPPHRARPQLT
jgi:heme/copper-type cytochrome/quinol oxidase subunit 1